MSEPHDLMGAIRLRLAHIEDELGLDRGSAARATQDANDPLFRQVLDLRDELRQTEHRLSKRLAALEASTSDPAAWKREEGSQELRLQHSRSRKPGAE